MIRKSFLKKFKENSKSSKTEFELDRIRSNDDNVILENYRPIKQTEIETLSNDNLNNFADQILFHPKINSFLFSNNSKSLRTSKTKANLTANNSKNKSNTQSCIMKLRDKKEIISLVTQEIEKNKIEKTEYVIQQSRKNEDFIKNIKLNKITENPTSETYRTKRIGKVFKNIQEKLEKLKLPDVKLNNSNVFSRLYHNTVFNKSKNTFQNNTANDNSFKDFQKENRKIDNLKKKVFKIKNVLENSEGKEFSTKITDETVMKCFQKHSGGPISKMKLTNLLSPSKQNSNKILENYRTENGENFLHQAVIKGSCDLVDYLIYKGLDVNEKNVRGDTPLHFAMRGKNLEIIGLLLKHQACLEIPNNENKTPFHYANAEIRRFFNLEDKFELKKSHFY